MNTLIVRTKEDLYAIQARSNSGNWILTDNNKINALIRNGEIHIHPIKKGRYNQILKAEITNIRNHPTEPRRKIIYFKNAHMIAATTQYKTQWVVKFI